MNRRQITYFVAVADAASFSRAAESLHISQSALSARIAELEVLLQAGLFHRGPRGVTLTQAGCRLLPHARAILHTFEQARRAMADAEPAAQESVLIGVTPTLGASLLPAILRVTQDMGSGLVWRAQQAASPRLVAMLDAGALDAALCYTAVAPGRARTYPVQTEDMVLIGARSTLRPGGDIAFAELAAFALVLDPLPHPSRDAVAKAAHRTGTTLQVRAEIEPLSVKKLLVLDQGLCTIAPSRVFQEELASGACHARRIVSPRLPLKLWLLLARSLGEGCADLVRAVVREAVKRA